MIKVTVWNEFLHERKGEVVKKVYPEGIHAQIKSFLDTEEDITVRTATLDEPECGLTEEVLNDTDVLIWWAHMAHEKVPDEIARRVADRVLMGMGMIFLHSAHYSKPMKILLGTTCSLAWRDGSRERLWCTAPTHPIAQGLPLYIDIEREEMYGEFFDVPKPDDVVFTGWYNTGEVFRSVITYVRGHGKIVYIQPGHETNPIYYNPYIQKIIKNAVRFAAPCENLRDTLECSNEPAPLEK
ncbi:MAG: ThuA domain-containing protein [Bacillota bacterium]|nr:ThuA domain-containing protein [Bacillota bacterium]